METSVLQIATSFRLEEKRNSTQRMMLDRTSGIAVNVDARAV